jgi:hypothetical protein
MAQDRLYLVNKDTKEYVMIAKTFGEGWALGNVHALFVFLSMVNIWTEKLIIGSEEDNDFYNEHIRHGKNLNKNGHWHYWDEHFKHFIMYVHGTEPNQKNISNKWEEFLNLGAYGFDPKTGEEHYGDWIIPKQDQP